MGDSSDKLYELCVECQRRVGSLLLTLLLVSTLYWLSFFLFLEDPRHNLIKPARAFVEQIDQLEQDHLTWQSLKQAEAGQVTHLADNYLLQLEKLPKDHAVHSVTIDLDVQARLPDRVLTDFLSRTGARNYSDVVSRWALELKDLRVNKIVYTSEVLELYKPYDALNAPPGWLSATAAALDLVDVPPVPAELDTLPWQDLRGQLNVLFAELPEFERKIQELQTFWQGEITDEMQARTLHGTGVWLRNLESGRSIAQGFIRKEPNIRLPFLGENISGRWAFYVGPLVFVILLRYLRVLAQHIQSLERELRLSTTGKAGVATGDATLSKLARYPNLIEVLRTAPRLGGSGWSWVNRALVAAVLLMPVSTLLPIVKVDWTIAGPTARWALGAFVTLTYSAILFDTIWLLRHYADPESRAGRS